MCAAYDIRVCTPKLKHTCVCNIPYMAVGKSVGLCQQGRDWCLTFETEKGTEDRDSPVNFSVARQQGESAQYSVIRVCPGTPYTLCAHAYDERSSAILV